MGVCANTVRQLNRSVCTVPQYGHGANGRLVGWSSEQQLNTAESGSLLKTSC